MAELNGNGNGNGKNWVPTLTLLSLIAGMSAIVFPMRQSIEDVAFSANKALHWEDDYTRGLIPSSAEKELAAQEQKFVEIETQFRGAKEQTLRDEKEIDLLRQQVSTMLQEIAVLKHERHLPEVR